MELREFFSEDAIQLNLQGTTKDEILKELIALLKLDEKSDGMLFKMLKRRENLGSGAAPETLGQHERILERISAHDVDGARSAMTAHLDGVAAVWKQQRAAREESEETPAA